jgi:hypothetical protein
LLSTIARPAIVIAQKTLRFVASALTGDFHPIAVDNISFVEATAGFVDGGNHLIDGPLPNATS